MDKEVMVELKACPSATVRCNPVVSGYQVDDQIWLRRVECLCGWRGPEHESEAEAIAAWNERAASAVPVNVASAKREAPEMAERSINIVARQQSPVVADYDENYLVARVNKDGTQVGIDHPCDAVWSEVMTAHIALRDYINERIERQDNCPFKAKAALSQQQPPAEGEDDAARELLAEVEQATLNLAAIHRRLIGDISEAQQRQWPAPEHAWADCGTIMEAVVALEQCKAALARTGQDYQRGVRDAFEAAQIESPRGPADESDPWERGYAAGFGQAQDSISDLISALAAPLQDEEA